MFKRKIPGMVKIFTIEQAVHDFPEMMEQAAVLSQSLDIPWGKEEIQQIVVLGMGGSSIGGEMAKAVSQKYCEVPVQLVRDEALPAYVNKKTVVIAVSYSGNTKETLTGFESAAERTNKILGISSGGKLKEKCLENRFPYLEIPSGWLPRAALPYSFVPLLSVLEKLFLFPEFDTSLKESIEIVKHIRKELKRFPDEEFEPSAKLANIDNAAKDLARNLRGKIPVIYAESPLLEPAANRWKCQINENAKQPAYFQVLPEAYHNDIVGFTAPLPLHSKMAAIFLRESHPEDNQSKGKSTLNFDKLEFFKKIIQSAGIQTFELFSKGESLPAKLLSLSYFGDYVSLYLAEENQVNPEEIQVIDQLKKRFV